MPRIQKAALLLVGVVGRCLGSEASTVRQYLVVR